MTIQSSTALWLANNVSSTTTQSATATSFQRTSDATVDSGLTESNFTEQHRPTIAIADRLSDTSSAASIVQLRAGSLEQLGNFLSEIKSRVEKIEVSSELSSVDSNVLLDEIGELEKQMSQYIGENLITDVNGSVVQRQLPESGFDRFMQVVESVSADGAQDLLATIEVDMAEVLSHSHSPVSCPICQQSTSSQALGIPGSVSSAPQISEDAATTTTTNVTGAKATSTSSDGYVEALTHFSQWDLDEDEKLSYSFYLGDDVAPYDPNYGAVWPTYASPLNAQQQEQMREVYELWDKAVPFEFEEIIETGTDNVGELRVAYMTDPDQRPEAAAFAYIPNSGVSGGDAWYITDGVQDINGGYSYNLDFSKDYGRLVALHEIGHSIGLSHPHDGSSRTGATFAQYGIQDDSNTTVMSYTNAPSYAFYDNNGSVSFNRIYASTPMVYDVAAVEFLYGEVTDTNVDDTTYAITDRAYIQTLVDSGGTDTIDVSAVNFRSIINLTPGSFNDVGYATEAEQNAYFASQGAIGSVYGGDDFLFTGTDNLGIALSATIENIVGSSGDDQFTGNSVNNVIKGNAGDDQIDGGGGGANYAVFNGAYSGYRITETSLGSGNYTVEDTNLSDGDDGTDTLTNIQYFEFSDQTYNPRAGTSEATGSGALSGDASTPSGATGAVATAISIASNPATQEQRGFTPFSAAHSISGINLLTEEGKEEALILLEIGLSHVTRQASRLGELGSNLESELSSALSVHSSDRNINSAEISRATASMTKDIQALVTSALPKNKADVEALRSLVTNI